MGIGIGELALILVIVLIVFGAGKLPKVMNDLGKGVKSFKDGINEGEKEHNAAQTSKTEQVEEKKDV